MPTLGDCPGESVYDRGSVRVLAQGATQQAAETARDLQMDQAKQDALDAQTDSFQAALVVGDAACKPGQPPCDPCTAVFWGPPLSGPWRAAGTLHDGVWKARGGYKWKLMVECECPPVVVAGKKKDKKQYSG
jgi:hypothetical protein